MLPGKLAGTQNPTDSPPPNYFSRYEISTFWITIKCRKISFLNNFEN